MWDEEKLSLKVTKGSKRRMLLKQKSRHLLHHITGSVTKQLARERWVPAPALACGLRGTVLLTACRAHTQTGVPSASRRLCTRSTPVSARAATTIRVHNLHCCIRVEAGLQAASAGAVPRS